MNRNNFTVILILFSIFVTGFFAGNLYVVNELNNIELPDQNITVDRPDYEVNNNYDPERFFYIQPPNTNVSINWNGKTAEIEANEIINTHGSSMRPTIWTGNTVLAQETNGKNLDEGTIVSNGNITHRIKADYTETSGYYLTQGDNNDGHERMKPEEISHKIVGVIYTEKQD